MKNYADVPTYTEDPFHKERAERLDELNKKLVNENYLLSNLNVEMEFQHKRDVRLLTIGLVAMTAVNILRFFFRG